jgi:hypothetical protein
MTKEDRINSFKQLKDALLQLDYANKIEVFAQASASNAWFTQESIVLALNSVLSNLDEEILTNWLANYDLTEDRKKIGIVMAGNIPLVGFHDFLSVLLAGHVAVIKLSSQDKVLMKHIIDLLININSEFEEQILVVDILPKVDAVIATGSDNSARYFKKYFGNSPHIIRKNRTSIAVLEGDESVEELRGLGSDIFSFFGLGCRNVAKVYVPAGYDMTHLLDSLENNKDIIHHPKYFNNYEYNKAIFLVNRVEHLDTGYVLFTKSSETVSPLAVVYYEEYTSKEELIRTLSPSSEKIQCVVSSLNLKPFTTLPFGKAQHPAINDYADNVDTMKFLCNLA